jgi:hypothetical protein
MDDLCHTLVGLAIGEAGPKRRTALGYAARVPAQVAGRAAPELSSPA